MDSDRVLVMDAGCVSELDTPGNLLANEQSMFYSLANSAGLI
jgi:ABC-type multidrug transport system fused ATPase/permease subunit